MNICQNVKQMSSVVFVWSPIIYLFLTENDTVIALAWKHLLQLVNSISQNVYICVSVIFFFFIKNIAE